MYYQKYTDKHDGSMDVKEWKSYLLSVGVGGFGLTLNDVLETVFLTVSIASLCFNIYIKNKKL